MITLTLICDSQTGEWCAELRDKETDVLLDKTPWRKQREKARTEGLRERERLLEKRRASV